MYRDGCTGGIIYTIPYHIHNSSNSEHSIYVKKTNNIIWFNNILHHMLRYSLLRMCKAAKNVRAYCTKFATNTYVNEFVLKLVS